MIIYYLHTTLESGLLEILKPLPNEGRHFFNDYADPDSQWNANFIHYFKKVDDLIGELLEKISDDTAFILVSDHATALSKGEVYLNTWLKNEGLLKMKPGGKATFDDIDPTGTKVFALDSGRIYLNRRGMLPVRDRG